MDRARLEAVQHAFGSQRCGGHDGRRPGILLQYLVQCLAAALHVGRVAMDAGAGRIDICLLKRLQKALEPIGARTAFPWATDVGNASVPQFQQMLRGLECGGYVVDSEPVRCQPRMAAYELHMRCVLKQLQRLVFRHMGGNPDDARHARLC